MKQILECIAKKEMPWANRANQSTNNLILSQKFSYVKSVAKQYGIAVFKNKDGYLVSKWNMCRQVYSDHELVNFLQKMGVKL